MYLVYMSFNYKKLSKSDKEAKFEINLKNIIKT